MQLKPIAAIAVLLLVAASLLVAGCTTSSDSKSGTISTDYPTSGRSELVEGAIEYQRNSLPSSTQFTVEWKNNTWAVATEERQDGSTFVTGYRHYPSVDKASAWFDDLIRYVYAKETSASTLYHDITGKWPTVSRARAEADEPQTTLQQYDALIVQTQLTKTPTATKTPTSTPTSISDKSSYITSQFSEDYAIVTPFKKSTNSYGNVVYTGVVKETPEKKLDPYSHKITIELTKDSSSTKARYAQYKTQLLSSGLVKEFDYGDYMTFYDGSTYNNPAREAFLDMNEPGLITHIYNTGIYLSLGDTFTVTVDDTTKL